MCPDSITPPAIAPKKPKFPGAPPDFLRDHFIHPPTPDSVFDSIFTDRVLDGIDELQKRGADREAGRRVCFLTATTGDAEALRNKLQHLDDPGCKAVAVSLTGSPAAAGRHAFEPLRGWIVAPWLSDPVPSLRRRGLRWASYLAFQAGADDVVPINPSAPIDLLEANDILGLFQQSLDRQTALDRGEIEDAEDHDDVIEPVTADQWLFSSENPSNKTASMEELAEVVTGLRTILYQHDDQSALQRALLKLSVWEKENRVALDAAMGWLEDTGDAGDVAHARDIIRMNQNAERQAAGVTAALNEPIESLEFKIAIDRLARWKHPSVISGGRWLPIDDSRYQHVMAAIDAGNTVTRTVVKIALAAGLETLQQKALKGLRWITAGELADDPGFDSSRPFKSKEAAEFFAAQRLNAEAAVLRHENQALILVEEQASNGEGVALKAKFRLMKYDDAKLLYMNQKIQYEHTDDKGETKLRTNTIIEHFVNCEFRREFYGLTCERYCVDDDTPITERRYSKLRLYNTAGDFGWGCKPVSTSDFDASKIAKIQEHIEHVLCGDDPVLIDFLYDWLADLVQRPASKPGTCIVLKSREGAGKGIIVNNLMRRIIGSGFKQMINKEHLIGKFNFQLADAHLIYADELFWGGDKQAEGILKGLITESTINLELKNKDVTQVPFPARIIIASNENWVVPAGAESRRYVVLEPNGERAGDSQYFNALGAEIEAGAGHFFRFLLDRDLSRPGASNLRVSPVTKGLIDQRERSAGGTYEWWRAFLDSGQFTDRSEGAPVTIHWTTDRALDSKTIHEAVASYYRTSGKRHAPTWVSIIADLKKFCPSLSDARHRIGGVQRRGLQLPELADARTCMEAYMGGPLSWSPLPDGRAAAKQVFNSLIKQILESQIRLRGSNTGHSVFWPIAHLLDVTYGLVMDDHAIGAHDAMVALEENGVGLEGGIATIDLTHVTIATEIGRRITKGSLEDHALAAGVELRNGRVALNWQTWTARKEELEVLLASHQVAAELAGDPDAIIH